MLCPKFLRVLHYHERRLSAWRLWYSSGLMGVCLSLGRQLQQPNRRLFPAIHEAFYAYSALYAVGLCFLAFAPIPQTSRTKGATKMDWSNLTWLIICYTQLVSEGKICLSLRFISLFTNLCHIMYDCNGLFICVTFPFPWVWNIANSEASQLLGETMNLNA